MKSEEKLKTLIEYFFHDKSGTSNAETQAEFEMEILTLHNAPGFFMFYYRNEIIRVNISFFSPL